MSWSISSSESFSAIFNSFTPQTRLGMYQIKRIFSPYRNRDNPQLVWFISTYC